MPQLERFMPWQNQLLKMLLPLLLAKSYKMMVYLYKLAKLIFLASAVLFGNAQLSDQSVVIQSQLSSARHSTPVQKDARFNRSSSQPHLSVQAEYQQPQYQHIPPSSRSADVTPSYDMESWFNTFPPTQSQPQATDSSDFGQFQVPS
jgi:hypothetical protein